MTDAEFMFQLIATVSVLAGFIGILYGAYSKLIAPIVERLQVIGSQMDKFSFTLNHVDKKIEPIKVDIADLQNQVAELEKTVEVIKYQIETLKGK